MHTQNKNQFHKDVTAKNSSILQHWHCLCMQQWHQTTTNRIRTQRIRFSSVLAAVKGSLSFTGVYVAKKGCNSQTKHCASSSKQVMCGTYPICVLIMERALIQNNYPVGWGKWKGGKKRLRSCFFWDKTTRWRERDFVVALFHGKQECSSCST